jgi:hypothetical protein
MLVEKLSSSNLDLLNQSNLDKGALLNFSDDYSNFSINPFPSKGEIKIKTINWDKKELTYELILQLNCRLCQFVHEAFSISQPGNTMTAG